MGCCSSTPNRSAAGTKIQQIDQQTRACPPTNSVVEEESVKEVLLETEFVPRKPSVLSNYRHERYGPGEIRQTLPKSIRIPDDKLQKDRIFKKPAMIFHPDEISEDASENCSTKSECLASAKKNENKVAEIRQRSPAKTLDRSLSGDIARPRLAGKSPRKKPNQSPNKCRPGAGSGKDVRGFGSNAQKKDIGEMSGRRSLSPVTRAAGNSVKPAVGRSGPSGRIGNSPGRVKSEVGEKIRKFDTMSRSHRDNNKRRTRSNESLENPFVSLECFIFL